MSQRSVEAANKDSQPSDESQIMGNPFLSPLKRDWKFAIQRGALDGAHVGAVDVFDPLRIAGTLPL